MTSSNPVPSWPLSSGARAWRHPRVAFRPSGYGLVSAALVTRLLTALGSSGRHRGCGGRDFWPVPSGRRTRRLIFAPSRAFGAHDQPARCRESRRCGSPTFREKSAYYRTERCPEIIEAQPEAGAARPSTSEMHAPARRHGRRPRRFFDRDENGEAAIRTIGQHLD
jgi:hypothetical protein